MRGDGGYKSYKFYKICNSYKSKLGKYGNVVKNIPRREDRRGCYY